MENRFFPLVLSALTPGQELPFAIYLRARGENYFLYLPAGQELRPACYQHLCQCRVKHVYVSEKERGAQMQYLLKLLEKTGKNQELALETRVKVAYEVALEMVQEVLARPAPETIRNCETVARYQVELILSEPETLRQVLSLGAYDYHTYTHSVNVCFMLVALLSRLGLELGHQSLCEYALGALLHDLGKTRLDKKLLNKPARLDQEEFAEIKKHPILGVEIIKASAYPLPRRAETIILQHHEDLDGSGYPLGLSGEAIPLVSRLARIIDVYDALTSYRPYRPALNSFNALALMWQEFKGKVDQEMLREFIHILGPAPLAWRCPRGKRVKVIFWAESQGE